MRGSRILGSVAALALASLGLGGLSAEAQPLALGPAPPNTIFDGVVRDAPRGPFAAERGAAQVPAHLRRQIVTYRTQEPPGTVIVDTPNTYLYYVLGGDKAIRYGIGVGREGFTWSGVRSIGRKAEWPDWIPPAEMVERQPYLPRWMAGGPSNPLGARALYLSGTLFRIHGTNAPSTIGKHVSSGCIRMLNEDVIDLFNRVDLGTKVVVLPDARRRTPEPRTVRDRGAPLSLATAARAAN